MNAEQSMVKEFHERFGVPVTERPALPDQKRCDLRVELIREEFEEMQAALAAGDIVEVADALGDLKYVIDGAALEFGIDMEPVFREIHRSNMSKIWPDGEVHRREDGKVVKSPEYSPADVAGEIERQRAVSV